MTRFVMRLDDACEGHDVERWDRMEQVLDRYGVKPLVGVIPCCEGLLLEIREVCG